MLWCLHGNLGMSADWDILSQHPESPYRDQMIRKVDLWRYLACRSISLKEFGDIFCSEVAAQDSSPSLMAYSLGGRLALHALASQPDLWKSATLISTHPGLSSEEEKTNRRILDAEWSAKALQLPWGDFLKEWNQQSVLGPTTKNLPDRYLLQPRNHEIARAFCAWSLGTQDDHRQTSEKITCPVLLVTGAQDVKYTNLATQFRFPNAEHQIIPEAQHRPLWENPEGTLRALA